LSPWQIKFYINWSDGGVNHPDRYIQLTSIKRALNPSKVVMDFVVVIGSSLQSITAKPVLPFEPNLELTSASINLEDWLRSSSGTSA
jgi:hypothetical protein